MAYDPFRVRPPFVVSLSGGRTSAYMLRRVMDASGGGKLPEGGYVLFANTGREDEATLVFIRDIEVNWGVRVLWVEYTNANPHIVARGKQFLIGGHGYKVVNFDTADRIGKPFRELVMAKALFRQAALGKPPVLPNKQQRWCSGELKVRTMRRAIEDLYKLYRYTSVIGIRADEPDRIAGLIAADTASIRHVTPLADAGVEEAEILSFWRSQPFDLQLTADPVLGTYRGNCDYCFLKASAKRRQLLNEIPDRAQWWLDLEAETGQSFYGKKAVSLRRLIDERIPLDQCSTDDDGPCICTGD